MSFNNLLQEFTEYLKEMNKLNGINDPQMCIIPLNSEDNIFLFQDRYHSSVTPTKKKNETNSS